MAATCFGSLLRLPGRLLKKSTSPSLLTTRGRKQWHLSHLRALYLRRLEAGPEPERPRSAWLNWNYDAEIYAFGKRLQEEINAPTLKTVFTNRSYITKENKVRASSGVTGKLTLADNEELSEKGELLARQYIDAYLRRSLPLLPDDGVRAVCNYLLTDDMLSYIGTNIGMGDLILCEEFPASASSISQSVKALIGALAADNDAARGELFVRDFVVTQLIGKDINELWEIVNPMGLLVQILMRMGCGEPEPRLLRQAGSSTVTAVYVVGLYSDHKLIGEAPGESVVVAEEMAARDALKRLFGTHDNRKPFSFTATNGIGGVATTGVKAAASSAN